MMTDNYKYIVHGFPLDGQKITAIANQTQTWFTNVMEATMQLKVGYQYTVRKTELASSSSLVWLEEFPDEQDCFNLQTFEWEKPGFDPNDLIGWYVLDVFRLNYMRNIGIQDSTGIIYEGNPMLVIETDSKGMDAVVKKAYFKN